MELADKIVLLTGVTGFVGSRLVRPLLQVGMHVRALVRRPVEIAGVEPCLGDLLDPAVVQRAVAGTALIVHCASVNRGSREEVMRVNVEGTRLLLETAGQGGCTRFLHMSSAVVYAFDDRAVVDEATPFRQEGSAYHLSKVAAEQAVWARHALGLPVTVLRPYYILGGHPTSTWSALLAPRLLTGEYALQGHGQGSWPYVHVDNLAKAVVLAARSARAVGHAYNIVDGQTTAQAFTDQFRQWLGVGSIPSQSEVVPWCGHYSGAKAVRELGYTPRVTYEAAMAETHQYLRGSGIIKQKGQVV
jgi:nucleoside-diphosphate-sugar epimerase